MSSRRKACLGRGGSALPRRLSSPDHGAKIHFWGLPTTSYEGKIVVRELAFDLSGVCLPGLCQRRVLLLLLLRLFGAHGWLGVNGPNLAKLTIAIISHGFGGSILKAIASGAASVGKTRPLFGAPHTECEDYFERVRSDRTLPPFHPSSILP